MMKRKKLIAFVAGALAAIMVLSLVFSLIPVANAASSSEIKKQINEMKEQQEELKNQMKELQEAYEENEDEIARLVNEKNLIDQEIGLLYAQINLVNDQITAYNLLIADKQDELDQAQALYNDLKERNKARIRAMEEDHSLNYWSVLFEANSFFDLLDRLNMIQEIEASDRRRLQEMSDAAQQVEAAREELSLEKAELEVTRADLADMQLELDAKRTEADEILTELLKKAQEMEELQVALEQEDQELLDEIAQAEKEYNEAKHREYLEWLATSVTTTKPTTAPTTRPTSPTGGNDSTGSTGNTGSGGGGGGGSATWIRPCSYIYVSSPCGDRNAPTAGASSNHQGVDLAAPQGTPIYASRGGTVTVAKFSNSAGYYVTINHGDGFSSVYMHMTHYVVSKGQTVSQGQLIGYVGSTGISTGPHLHFGISYNGTYVNPALYINF
jgi:murein DD-endopeptidase MepM/ murein hydrolase activator NlpD